MDRLKQRFPRRKPFLATLAFMVVDGMALLLALLLAFFLRYENVSFQAVGVFCALNFWTLCAGILAYLGLFTAFRLYHHAWRYASVEIVWGVVAATTLGAAVTVAIQLVMEHTISPRLTIIFWMLTVALVGGARLLLRVLYQQRQSRQRVHEDSAEPRQEKRVVILGGGANAARLLQALSEDFSEYRVVGILDDRPEKVGVLLRGARVLGPLAYLEVLLRQGSVDEVLVALPEASGADIRPHVMACRRARIPVKIIPGLCDVLQGTARARLEDISVDDLLRRPPVCLDAAQLGAYVAGKRVLVTGAGGSIGSELCRQIAALSPEALVLLGHGENSIHRIHQELCGRFPALVGRLSMVICSVADEDRIAHIFTTHRPQVVFHAAAHKHVPIMEANIAEAVENNVLGTQCVADACGRHGVERMVLISTDKAVYPSSVMGATKWLCEEAVRARAAEYAATTYVTVRFGNVLGSRGSVVPIFKEQIGRGGPVTVTHPEMTRFFMTIPEAVQLVLQAGAVGTSGELYLLDMGKPVKIVDLARDMIRLAGLEPDVDIPITFTGLRPGEKLHEKLNTGDEVLLPASNPAFSVVVRPRYFPDGEYASVLYHLRTLATHNDHAALFAYLREVVPGFAQHSPTKGSDGAAASVLVSR